MTQQKIILISAVTDNGVIGQNGTMPWHIPQDLSFFKQTTLHHPMIMGRKTRDSFGIKPLPHRPHLVVSNNPDYRTQDSYIFMSVDDAIDYAKHHYFDKNIFIIGGGQIYKQTINMADEIFLTHIHKQIDGDTFFPEFDKTDYNITKIADYPDADIAFSICHYTKK